VAGWDSTNFNHFVFTYDGPGTEVLYYNGMSLTASLSPTSNNPNTVYDPNEEFSILYIGGIPYNAPHSTGDGDVVDDTIKFHRLYDGVLSSDDVSYLFNNRELISSEFRDATNYALVSKNADGTETQWVSAATLGGLPTFGTTLYVDDTTERVGIGTTSPTAKLDVNEIFSCHDTHVRVGNTDFGYLNQVALSVVAPDLGRTDGAGFSTFDDTNWILVFYNASRTADKGKIRGGYGSVFYDTTSDRRLKENITPMPSMLEKIKQLKPVYYTWKEGGKKGDGFIAQEVHKVLPQMRDYNCWDNCKCGMTFNDAWDGKTCMCEECDVENPKNAAGNDYTFGLDYGKFTPYIIKAIQEQQEIIERQEKLIQSLEARILSLESK
jgi:hypothetical protein